MFPNLQIIALVLLLTMCGGAYAYYKSTQSTIQELTRENLELEVESQSLEQTLNKKQEEFEKVVEKQEELTIRLQESEAYRNALVKTLRKHNLTQLALRKPGLIENRINDATNKIFEELKHLSTSD